MDTDDTPRWPYPFAAGLLVTAFLFGLWPGWFHGSITILLAFPFLLAAAAALACVLGLSISPVTAFLSRQPSRRLWRPPAALLGAVLLCLPVHGLGSGLSDVLSLLVLGNRFETQIAQARAGRDPCAQTADDDIACYVDRGPPLRIAWITNPGFLDNWSGIVFDPTGVVMQADGWDERGKWRAPDSVTRLFGGDLVSCRHLRGDYYVCAFT